MSRGGEHDSRFPAIDGFPPQRAAEADAGLVAFAFGTPEGFFEFSDETGPPPTAAGANPRPAHMGAGRYFGIVRVDYLESIIDVSGRKDASVPVKGLSPGGSDGTERSSAAKAGAKEEE